MTPEQKKIYMRKYRQLNKARIAAWRRERYLKHRESEIIRATKFNKENADSLKKMELKRNRTFEGMIKRIYSGMRQRVLGISGSPRHKKYYFGKPIMPKEDFLEWARGNVDLHRLHKQWANHNFEKRWKPSPDRLVSTGGYTKDNVEFVPFYVQGIRAEAVRSANKSKSTAELIGVFLNVAGQGHSGKKLYPGQKQAIYSLLNVRRPYGKKSA